MAIKKSELYSSLWASCDELRGGMDASQYKDYVLAMLFIKYVSDKYVGVPYAPITIPEGASFKDMVALKGTPDIGDQINKKIIGPLEKANKLSDMPDFNDPKMLGSGQEFVERVTNLISIFENKALDFSKNRADGDDILGDAYEYLMRHFAAESGKSKGQFYTPAEVSRVMAQIIGIRGAVTTNDTTVYDPTCGSGSLLLKVGDEASAKVTLYGQEKDTTTAGLARMNMILHNNPTALIRGGHSTLANPLFTGDDGQLKTFDYVIANPPFSDKRWGTGLDALNDSHERFKHYGIPPAKQGDYAYLLHIIRSLKSAGKGACILPHGVLFRGNAEADIRRNLIRRGYIKGIIGLPANLFYGTGIPACIVVIDKESAHTRKGIFMIDASAEFIKDGPKNRLRDCDIHKIVDVFNRRDDSDAKYARMVSIEEIEKNDFNLNIPRYIDSQQAEDIQDIEGHLKGGIPSRDADALNAYWEVCPQLRQALFKDNRPGYVDLFTTKQAIKSTIYEHPEFVTYIAAMNQHFAAWRERVTPTLKNLKPDCHPKTVIHDLSEDLLAHYAGKPLIDRYAVFQHLMDYWLATMQDDCYLIAADGWKAETSRIVETNKKGKEVDKGWTCDLIPKQLIVNRYFAPQQAAIHAQEESLESATAQLVELEEEHSGDGGILESVGNRTDALIARHEAVLAIWQANDPVSFRKYRDQITLQESIRDCVHIVESELIAHAIASAKGKITQAIVNSRLKVTQNADERRLLETYKTETSRLKKARETVNELLEEWSRSIDARLSADPDSEDLRELIVLDTYLGLTERIGALKKAIKDAEAELDALAYAQYPKLSEPEIKTLVVDDKWLAAIETDIHGEMNRISQALTQRVKELAERYESPLPKLACRVADLSAKVASHLKKMGFEA